MEAWGNAGALPGRVLSVSSWHPVRVNFMCQLGWAMGCLEIRSNIILGVAVRLILEEMNN